MIASTHMRLETDAAKPLAMDPWFSRLPRSLQDKLLSMGVTRRLPAGQVVVRRGQAHGGLFCLLQGAVLVMNELEPGNEGVLALFEAPAWFGEVGLFDGGAHSHTVQTDTPCTVMHLPRSALLAMLHDEPQAWYHLSLLMAAKLRLAFFALDERLKLSPEKLVARRLLAMAAGLGTRGSYKARIPIRQEHLAQSMGLARSTLNPILRNWCGIGWIQLTYGQILIQDLEALKAVAGIEGWPATYKDALGFSLDATAPA